MDWIRALYNPADGPMRPYPRNKAVDNMLRYGVSGIPVIGDLARFYDNSRAMNDYLNNRGISWEDVKYPSRLGNLGAGSVGNLITSVPDAYQKLYDFDQKDELKNLRKQHYETAIKANNMRRAWYYSRM